MLDPLGWSWRQLWAIRLGGWETNSGCLGQCVLLTQTISPAPAFTFVLFCFKLGGRVLVNWGALTSLNLLCGSGFLQTQRPTCFCFPCARVKAENTWGHFSILEIFILRCEVFCLYVVYIVWALHACLPPAEARRVHQIPEFVSCLPCELWEANLGPQEGQQVFLTAKPSLQPPLSHFKCFTIPEADRKSQKQLAAVGKGSSSVVENLSYMHKVLGSNPSNARKKITSWRLCERLIKEHPFAAVPDIRLSRECGGRGRHFVLFCFSSWISNWG